MAVTIDIPGIGNVEAKNAASEQTLKEILKVMQGVQRNTKDKPGGGGGGGDEGSKNPLSSAAGKLGTSLGKLNSSVAPVIGGFMALNNYLTATVKEFADVGDSLERAAKTIPVFGGLLSTVAGSSVKLNDAFLESSKSGATFGGSVREFARNASAAGMTLEKFGAFVARNGEGMLAFGTTTEEGAKRFTQVSKALRETSSDLYALGFSSDDINQGLATYGDLLRKQGLQGNKTNAELAAGAKNYMKEIDALAKITGEERSAKEAQMKQLATDVQFQMSMAGKSEETRMSFMKLIGGFGPTLGGFVKDFVANGTATSDANARIASALGGETMNELTQLRAKLQSNQQLSVEEQDRLRAIIKKAADAGAKQLGTSISASSGALDDMGKALIEGQQIQTDSVKNASAEQKKAAEEQEQFNKKIQEAQQRIAKFSNEFTVALANSGLLDFAMKAFGALATLVQTLVVPAFNVMASIISTVGGFLFNIGAFISDNLTPIFSGLVAAMTVLTLAYAPLIASTIANTVSTVANTASKAFNTIVTAINSAAGAALAAPFIAIAVAVGTLVALFVGLYKSGWTFSTAFEAVGDNLKRFGMTLMEFIDNIRSKLPPMLGGLSKDEMEARKKEREQARKELDDREKARDANRDQVKKERGIENEKEKTAKKAAEHDAKTLDEKKRVAAENAKIDYNAGPEELMKQFAKAEGSPLVPAKEAAAKAESTKKEIESKTEEKTKAEEKAKEEIKRENGGSSAPAATQESAESLLAQLNSNMIQLLKLTKEQKDIGERQLTVQRGLTSDLFAA